MHRVGKLESYRLVAERLNAKGVLPFSARQWSQALVQQTVYGKVNYPEVFEELKQLIKEFENARCSKLEHL
jgi:hypothetical protein